MILVEKTKLRHCQNTFERDPYYKTLYSLSMYKNILTISLLFCLKSYSQSIDISKNWLLNIGDSLDWASGSYNDGHWKTIENIGLFEDKELGEFQNFGWARKKLIIPSSLKDPAERSGFIYLSLGRINDADQTFFNGKLVGQTGGFPPAPLEVNRGSRIYKVDSKDVFWGKENQVAVRIFSNFRNGGLWDENFKIIVPSASIFHLSGNSISGYPLEKGQQSLEAVTKPDVSFQEKSLPAGGLALKMSLPAQASVFYNGKFVGKANFAGADSFFVPSSLISWQKPDKITVYLEDKDAQEKILFSTP